MGSTAQKESAYKASKDKMIVIRISLGILLNSYYINYIAYEIQFLRRGNSLIQGIIWLNSKEINKVLPTPLVCDLNFSQEKQLNSGRKLTQMVVPFAKLTT